MIVLNERVVEKPLAGICPPLFDPIFFKFAGVRHFLFILLSTLLFSCAEKNHPHTSLQGTEKKSPQPDKFYALPVLLNVGGINKDTSIRALFNEAFRARGIKLIGNEELLSLTEREGKRVGEKVFFKGAEFRDTDAVMRAMSREHKYIANILTITLTIHDRDDTSRMIYKAGWSNIPFPPDPVLHYVKKYSEIDLENLSISIRENINSIIDPILLSKELK